MHNKQFSHFQVTFIPTVTCLGESSVAGGWQALLRDSGIDAVKVGRVEAGRDVQLLMIPEFCLSVLMIHRRLDGQELSPPLRDDRRRH